MTVALSTLLGLDEQAAELEGYGPMSSEMARRIAADATGTWRRLVTDELGALIDYGRCTYRPPAALAEHVRARDRTCRFPGCRRRAQRCEIDHVRAWCDGGETNAANLHLFCPRHHHLKHEAGWAVRRLPDGTTRWLSPTEHTYDKPPDPYPVDSPVAPPDDKTDPPHPDAPPPF